MKKVIKLIFALAILLVMASSFAEAQWVMVARAASKHIRQMKQTDANGNGFDVATVILEAPANKVYETAIREIHKHSDLTIVKTDADSHTIQFSKGDLSASMMANSLGPKATELVIAASVKAGEPSSTWKVVDGVIVVCQQMKVECTLQK